MRRRLGTVARWLVALVLVAGVLGGGGPPPAEATPVGEEPGGGGSDLTGYWRCQTIGLRRGTGRTVGFARPPDTITGDPVQTLYDLDPVTVFKVHVEARLASAYADDENKYADMSSEEFERATRMVVLYCRDFGDDAWQRFDDYPDGGFRFSGAGVVADSPHDCVRLDRATTEVPELLPVLAYPGDYGSITPDVGGLYPSGASLYCGDQGVWLRQASPGAGRRSWPDYPECYTSSDFGGYEVTTAEHPDEELATWFRGPDADDDTTLYCRILGDVWRAFPDYPSGRFDFSRADEGIVTADTECVTVTPTRETPDVLPDNAYPGDYGRVGPQKRSVELEGEERLYCQAQGIWLRSERVGSREGEERGMPAFQECISRNANSEDDFPDQVEEDDHPSIGTWDPWEVATEFKVLATWDEGHPYPRPALYCRVQGSTWLRFDDYPAGGFDFSQADRGIVTVRGNPGSDGEHCVRVVPHHEMPEILEPGRYPGDYGPVYAEDEEVTDSQLFCNRETVWRRGSFRDLCRNQGLIVPVSNGPPSEDCWGAYPSTSYQIDYEADHSWNLYQKMVGSLTSLFFDLGKAAVQVALWLVGWVYSYDFEQWETFAERIGTKYDVGIVREAGLLDIAWFVLIAWAGFTALRGKFAAAASEVALSVVLLALATVLVANRGAYLSSALGTMDTLSNAVVRASISPERCRPPEDLGERCGTPAEQAQRDQEERRRLADATDRAPSAARVVPPWIEQLQRNLHREFVELPYQHLQWSQQIGPEHPCFEAANQVLALGPDVDGERRRDAMAQGGDECRNLAEWNKRPSGARLIGAMFHMGASGAVIYIIAIVAITAVVAKYVTAVLFIMAPFAAVAAVLPTGGRRLAWLWLSSIVQMILAVLVTTLLLSFILLGTTSVLELTASSDRQLIERWAILLVVLYTAFFFRRTMITSTRSAAGSMVDALTRLTPGGTEAANRPRPLPGGVDLLHMESMAKRSAVAAGAAGVAIAPLVGATASAGGRAAWAASGVVRAPVRAGGRTVMARLVERRQAHRARRNLVRMEQGRQVRSGPQFVTPEAGTRPAGGDPLKVRVRDAVGHVPNERDWWSRRLHPIQNMKERKELREVLHGRHGIDQPNWLERNVTHRWRSRSDFRHDVARLRMERQRELGAMKEQAQDLAQKLRGRKVEFVDFFDGRRVD